MTVLAYSEILSRCGMSDHDSDDTETSTGIIRPCVKSSIKTASYDLRVGNEYYRHEEADVDPRATPLPSGATITIPSNGAVIVKTHEKIYTSGDLVAHISLKMSVMLNGVILSNQSQVDVNYEGFIYVLLYNLSDEDHTLDQGEPFLRIEFCQIHGEPSLYRGRFKHADLNTILQKKLPSGLKAARDAVDDVDKRLSASTYILVGLQIVVVLVIFAIRGVATYHDQSRLAELEQRVKDIEKTSLLLDNPKHQLQKAAVTSEVNEAIPPAGVRDIGAPSGNAQSQDGGRDD